MHEWYACLEHVKKIPFFAELYNKICFLIHDANQIEEKTKTKKILQAAIFYLVMLSTDAKMQNDRSTDSHHHALLNTEQIVVKVM